MVHKWRAEEQAILVGTNTVIQDNPSLTVRLCTGHNPIRVVLDRALKLDKNLNVFNDEAETLVISSKLEVESLKLNELKNSFPFKGKVDSDLIKSEDGKVNTWNLKFIDWNLNNSI